MRFSEFKKDKGVAGLTILLSLVVMLFIIGLIVMIFTLMSAELRDATYSTGTSRTVTKEAVNVNQTGDLVALSTARSFGNPVVTDLWNATQHYAVANATINATGYVLSTTDLNFTGYINYTYTYSADNTATDVINDTGTAIATVIDWFSIFIVIGAMVVLILLTVIIITAIRGSGMIETGGTQTGNQNVGSA